MYNVSASTQTYFCLMPIQRFILNFYVVYFSTNIYILLFPLDFNEQKCFNPVIQYIVCSVQ